MIDDIVFIGIARTVKMPLSTPIINYYQKSFKVAIN